MTKSRISLSGAVAIVICTAMILAGVHAAAQGVGGSVSGTVTAASGAVVKGATVTLTEMHKHQIVRTATTNSVGFYAAAALPPGTYSESVAADNFATSVLNGIVLHANDTLLVDQKLKAGDAKQSTTAISGKTRLNAVDAASTDLVNSVQVHGLPLANDNYTLLGKLTPGFVALGADSPYVGDAIPGAAGVLFGAAGHTTANVYWTLDGADNMDRATNQTTMNFPAAGAIQEVKVIRQNYSALLGRSIGAQAIVTTRSGSNELHGSLYEHFRNNAMNANYYYNNYAWPTVQTPESRYNEFGGTIGGPVVIENTYNGRDRTFFFVSTNILRNVQSTPVATYEPLPSELGLTTAGTYTFANTVCISTNATTGACNTVGSPTGTSLAAVTSTTAKAYIKDVFANMPAPNPNPSQDAHTLTYNSKGYYNDEQELARLDHRFNAKWSMSYRFLHDSLPSNGANGPFADTNDLPGVNYNKAVSPATNHVGRLTYVRSPRTLIDFNYSFSTNAILSNPDGLMARANSPDIAPSLPYANLLGIIPTLKFQNGPTLTGAGLFQQRNQTHTIGGTLTRVWKTHTVTLGGVAYHTEHIASAPTNNAGIFNFSGANAPSGSSNAVLFQQAVSNFLQGVANGGFTQTNFPKVADLVAMQEEGFGQDNWRVNKRLSVSVGIRYSHFLQPTDNNGEMSTFLPSKFISTNVPTMSTSGLISSSPGTAYDPYNGMQLGNYWNTYSHYSQYGAQVAYTDKKDFAPRVGLAYDLTGDGKTTVRAGYGWVFDDPAFNIYDQAVFNNIPYVYTTTYGTATMDTVITNDFSTQSAGTEMPQTLWATPRSMHMPYSQQYTVSIEHLMAHDVLVEASYSGTHDTHLLGMVDINELAPGVAAGTSGLQPTGGFTTAYSEVVLNTKRPYLGYGPINSLQSIFNANYNALMVKAQKRMKHDSLLDVNYTWSKAMTNSPTDRGGAVQNANYMVPEYGRSPLDRKQVLTFDAVYALPWMMERKDAVGYVLSGWKVSGLATLAAGQPLTATISNLDSAGMGLLYPTSTAVARPNQIASPNFGTQTLTIHNHSQWFNPNAFTLPTVCTAASSSTAPCYPGNEHPGSIVGSGISRIDVALYKDFKVEWASVQFRAEAYNVLNHTNWTTIGTNMSSTTFGLPTGSRDPRTLQLDVTAHF